jgi:hypothetical protein
VGRFFTGLLSWSPKSLLFLSDYFFLRFRKFSAIILLNMLSMFLVCTYSSSSMPMIHRFDLLMVPQSSACCLYFFNFSLSFLHVQHIYLVSRSDILTSIWSYLLQRFSTEFLFDLLNFSLPEFQFDSFSEFLNVYWILFHSLHCLISFSSLFEFS